MKGFFAAALALSIASILRGHDGISLAAGRDETPATISIIDVSTSARADEGGLISSSSPLKSLSREEALIAYEQRASPPRPCPSLVAPLKPFEGRRTDEAGRDSRRACFPPGDTRSKEARVPLSRHANGSGAGEMMPSWTSCFVQIFSHCSLGSLCAAGQMDFDQRHPIRGIQESLGRCHDDVNRRKRTYVCVCVLSMKFLKCLAESASAACVRTNIFVLSLFDEVVADGRYKKFPSPSFSIGLPRSAREVVLPRIRY